MESVHEGVKKFKCNICEFSTAYKQQLQMHISSVHEGIKLFKCNLCDCETAEKGDLKRHV